ncbi:MAG: helix-turn-helix domain-containing protein [Rubrivivax sp.]
MTETDGEKPPSRTTMGAGALLRQAREAQGLHIAALAASLKVPPAKLEALEQDRFDLLPDATFARALALTVCRVLKLDPAPVLAQLPRAGDGRLEHVATGLNTPFRQRAGAADPTAGGTLLHNPVLWIVALLLAGAAAIYFWPRPGAVDGAVTSAAVDVATAADAAASAIDAGMPASASEPRVETAPPVPADGAATTAGVSAEAGSAAHDGTAAQPLAVRVRETSWVEVTDAGGSTLLSRTVAAGETVALDGRFPMRLTIGNAGATEVLRRGQPVNLAPHVRDNIARLELP